MPRYRYKAKTIEGKAVRGTKEAAEPRYLLACLKEKGLYCYEYHIENMEQSFRPPVLRRKALPPFCKQLSAMLGAGVALSKALEVSHEATEDKALKEILLCLIEHIHKGMTLSEAMECMEGVFPNLLVYMVSTGESSGRLDEILGRMAEYYRREEELRGKVRIAMIYPVILLGVTIGAAIFMLTTVLPQFASMLEEQELPLLTRVMMGVSFSLRSHGALYCLLLLILLAMVMGALTMPYIRLRADRALFRLPIVGNLLRTIDTSRFSSAFAVLYGSGIGILEAIHTTGKVMGNSYVEQCLEEAGENLKKGEMISQALKRLDLFHPVLISMVVAGEESGSLEEVLEDAGGYYEGEAARAIGQMIALLEPVMILVMALIVGSIVMAIMMPVFTMYTSML